MLSAVITAWNEEKDIARAISSVKKLANEIVVVVDEATTDRTAQVAKKLGASIFTHPHTGIVEPIRNFSISKATGDWILLLDADEEVPAGLAKKIKELIKDPSVDYYRLPRKNIIFGKWITSDHWWPDYVYRLFRHGAVTWENAVHSIPITRGQGRDLPAQEELSLIHHNYSTVSEYLEQIDRYTQKTALPASFAPSDLVTKPIGEFLSQYFARRGYTQGLHGLALAGLQMFSEFVRYLKAWQSREFVQTEFSSKDLTAQLKNKAREYRWWNSPPWLRPWL